MPYRGRPSAGCQTCRQRKIKCDRQDPTCENCKKAGWKCPGYPDLTTLIFHDESAKIVDKVRAAQRKNRVPSPPSKEQETWVSNDVVPSTTSRPQNEMQLVSARSAIAAELPQNQDDLAVGHFFHHYVHDFRQDNTVWYIEDGNGCLVSSIKAVGIAGMTRDANGPSFSREAQRQYLDAIQLTNAALGSPDLAKLDSTLLTINVLSIFESISGFHRSMNTWRDHINGASALLAIRGAKQFETATAGRLFIQTSTNLSIGCVQQRVPIPDHVRAMRIEAEKHVPDPTDRAWRFFTIQLRYTDLYAKLRPGNLVHSPDDAPAILQEAMAIEDDFIALMIDLPRDWQYEVVEATGPSVFAGYCHIFPTFLWAQIRNATMSMRLILNDIMMKAVRAIQDLPYAVLPAGTEERLQNAVQTVTRLQLHIFASVPQHLGTGPGQSSRASFPNVEAPSLKRVTDDCIWRHFTAKDCSPWRTRRKQSPDLPFVRMSGGYLIQWSIFTAGLAGRPGSKSRTFAMQTLRYIGQRLGLQQAIVLANTLEEDSGLKIGVYSSI